MNDAKDALLLAAINCPHHIDAQKITLEFDSGPGRLTAAVDVVQDIEIAALRIEVALLTARNSALSNEVKANHEMLWGDSSEIKKDDISAILVKREYLNLLAQARKLQKDGVSGATEIAELKAQLAAEVERLDFVLSLFDLLSNKCANHSTSRAAIDAAIALAKGGK